jgi:hypothetical protein
LELRRRLGSGGAHRSHLAARLFARPTWTLTAAPVHAALDAGVSVESHLSLRSAPVGAAHDPAFLIAIQTLRTSFSPTASGPLTEARVSLGIELR